METDSEAKAEFAEFLSKKESYQIKIPKEGKTVEEILKNYKNYLTELKKALEQNAHEKLHDWNLAEKMAKEIIDEWNLEFSFN